MESNLIIDQAEKLFASNDYLKAMESLNLALDLNGERESGQAFFLKGRCLQNLNKTKEAIECYNHAIKLNHIGAHNYKAFLIQLTTESKYLFERALILNIGVKNAQDLKDKADSLQGLGKYIESIECYNKAAELDPNDSDIFNNKGTSFHKMKRFQEAIDCFNKAIELNPKNAISFYNKGKTYI